MILPLELVCHLWGLFVLGLWLVLLVSIDVDQTECLTEYWRVTILPSLLIILLQLLPDFRTDCIVIESAPELEHVEQPLLTIESKVL